jgi:POT family proton-dependent oligopeptide transporter
LTAPAPAAPIKRGGFFGEPAALGYLAFTEAWERFSYYGMTALLALYMSKALLIPGRVEHIAGFAAFRAGLAHLFGPMTTLALASQILGLYTAFVYFTPVLGGIVADRFTGRRAAVVIGAVLMSAGHIAMAFDASFLVALGLLIVGCGLLKGNISTQVGQLYPEDDGEGRTRGFAIFSMGINVGAVAGPLLCGLLAQIWGWHVGFGCAGVLMLLGLATYLAGFRYIPEDSPRAARAEARAEGKIGAREGRIIAALGVVTFITVFQSIAYYQNTNINLVWIDAKVDLALFGFHVPVAWFSSIDPFASIVCVPPLFALWRWQAGRGREPDDIGKVAWGAWIAAVSNLILVAACLLSPRPSLLWPFIYDFGLGVAFLYYWPPLLALVSRAAPPQVKATLMGAVFLSLFLADFLVGRLGALYEPLGPTNFWLLHAGIAAAGGVLATVLARPLKRALDIA